MRNLFAVLCLAIVTPIFAELPKAPAKIAVKQGELARVEVAVPEGGLSYASTATDEELFVDELVSKTGKLRLVIQGKKDGTYYVAFVNGKDIAFTQIVVGGGQPQPLPPGPNPEPVPSPFSGKLKAYIITESADKNINYSRIFADKRVVDYWTQHQFLTPVIADPDVKDAVTNAVPIKLKPYLDRAKGLKDQMYLVDASKGTVLYEGNAPADADALLKIVGGIK